ncbi:hypothetical protein [Demequina pelophila]|uniref:hypothetical protein n=1 Tax=Demequina pelophila TaxID=1638984 RepID=UPI000A3ECB20|nr:hypothetical protein [Demequina pelophila]
MADTTESQSEHNEVEYPAEVREALLAVTELPDDLEQQAEFFERVQQALATRLREDTQ